MPIFNSSMISLCNRQHGFRPEQGKTAVSLQVMTAVILTLVVWVFPQSRSVAMELRATLGSEIYAWKENNRHHLRPYETLQANLMAWRTQGKSLQFHANMRYMTDWRDKTTVDPQANLYDAYVQLTGIPKGSTVTVGRQFAYAGTGSTLLDGMRLRYYSRLRLSFDLFGGSQVSSSRPDKMQSLSDFGILGGGISYSTPNAIRFGLSWLRRQADGQTSYHRLSLYGENTTRQTSLYGRAAYNVADQRLAEILLRGTYSPQHWYLSCEFNSREPSVSSSSIFSIIDFRSYRQIRLEIRRAVWKSVNLTTQMHRTFFQGDDAWRTGVGFSSPNYSLLWMHQSGYGGDNDAVSGFLNFRVSPIWELYMAANISRYRVQTMQTDRNEAYTAMAGVSLRPIRDLEVRVESQYLRNAVERDDLRLRVRVTKSFRLGRAAREMTP
jgi:hypothetical protein